MSQDRDSYLSPLSTRYASREMRFNFSERKKFTTWRKLWVALAQSESELGLPISAAQIAALQQHIEDIDFEAAERFERELRHDVMAHVHAYGEQVPEARGILHLGATSCYVTDNTDVIVMRDGLALLRRQLVSLIAVLKDFALAWRSLPTLGLTHYQPAQATTVGKRATLWLQDLVHDLEDLDYAESRLRLRGVKGTTGTQASFLALFDGDHAKVRELERRVVSRMGFQSAFGVTGQTYPRQLDFRIGQVLSSMAQSAHKFAVDLRLLAGRRELEEPFESKQIGSSAMPWKRNPMRCERICGLARHVISNLDNLAHTAANQWMERTLDDSANRRLAIAEMFLGLDAVLNLYLNVAAGLVVHPEMVRRNLLQELPFLAGEELLMEAVKRGGDRQVLHERLRLHSRTASAAVQRGEANPLVGLVQTDAIFAGIAAQLPTLLAPERFVGRAPQQVEEYVRDEVEPWLQRYAELVGAPGQVRV